MPKVDLQFIGYISHSNPIKAYLEAKNGSWGDEAWSWEVRESIESGEDLTIFRKECEWWDVKCTNEARWTVKGIVEQL